MKYKLTFALVAALTSTAFAEFKAPLPEFKNAKQLAELRAEKASETSTKSATHETAFYTGKPYLASCGEYAFKYRNYNPELARWTSEDPSGFPDGANDSIYAPTPTNGFDYEGLNKTVITKEFYYDDLTNYYSHDQIRIDCGMDITLVLNVRRAAYQQFQNDIAQSYSVGDQITKGKRVGVSTAIVSDSASLVAGYPKSKITSIKYGETSDLTSLNGWFGYTFHAYINSESTYMYE